MIIRSLLCTVLAGAFLLPARGSDRPVGGTEIAASTNAPVAASGDTSNPSKASDQQSPYLTEAKMLGEYTDRHGFRRKYILVAHGLDDAQLTDLARRLHAVDKDAWLWLLDDDSHAKQMLAALPATEQGDLTSYPGTWVEAHTLAHSVMEIKPGGGKQWVLYRGPYTAAELARLD